MTSAPAIPVIWNPAAGRKAGVTVTGTPEPAEFERLLAGAGVDATLVTTDSEAEADRRIRDAVAAGERAVVVAGGDGTVRAAARTLVAAGAGRAVADLPALGILPLGSIMNIARSLGIPRDLEAAVAVLAAGHTRTIDAARVVGGDPFFEGLVVGLHAELFAEASAFDDGDRLAPLRAVRTVLQYRPARIDLRFDGRALATRALLVTVSNGPYVGLGFTVAPGARLDDGLLDVRVFERFSRLDLLRHFWSIALGRRTWEPRVRTWRAARVTIGSDERLRVRADGEDAGLTPVAIEAMPAALGVIVPRPGTAPA